MSLRVEWFDHVRKTRKKLSKETKEVVSHRDAMKAASTTWPEVKSKLTKKIEREKRKAAKQHPSKKKNAVP